MSATTEEAHSDAPPAETAHGSVVANHYNQLQNIGLDRRHESKIFYMRNFNNWIKSQLIHEYSRKVKTQGVCGHDNFRVLDMCCGKGGDLLKWSKSFTNYVVFTDIADVSVQQCQTRYDELKNRDNGRFERRCPAEFIVCDSSKERLKDRYKDSTIRFGLVSCQFALHYSFESFEQADCMVRNAAECLLPGGYFIATLPNANEIMKRLRAAPNTKHFGNKLYQIEFECDTEPPPLFGAKYNFHLEEVVDCPEFLVHFPTLIELCKRHSLELERKTTFADYYAENNNREAKNLLKRMKAAQEIIIGENLEPRDEYEHVYSSGEPPPNAATLSKSEWEATSVYLVCAFKKIQ